MVNRNAQCGPTSAFVPSSTDAVPLVVTPHNRSAAGLYKLWSRGVTAGASAIVHQRSPRSLSVQQEPVSVLSVVEGGNQPQGPDPVIGVIKSILPTLALALTPSPTILRPPSHHHWRSFAVPSPLGPETPSPLHASPEDIIATDPLTMRRAYHIATSPRISTGFGDTYLSPSASTLQVNLPTFAMVQAPPSSVPPTTKMKPSAQEERDYFSYKEQTYFPSPALSASATLSSNPPALPSPAAQFTTFDSDPTPTNTLRRPHRSRTVVPLPATTNPASRSKNSSNQVLGSYFSPLITPGYDDGDNGRIAPVYAIGSYFSPMITPSGELATSLGARIIGERSSVGGTAETPEGDHFPYIAFESASQRRRQVERPPTPVPTITVKVHLPSSEGSGEHEIVKLRCSKETGIEMFLAMVGRRMLPARSCMELVAEDNRRIEEDREWKDWIDDCVRGKMVLWAR